MEPYLSPPFKFEEEEEEEAAARPAVNPGFVAAPNLFDLHGLWLKCYHG